MEVKKLKTNDDLIAARIQDERIELINGEIIKRPMARAEHAAIQLEIGGELKFLKRKEDPGGWWIMTEIDVCYNEHQCPTHDLAGWRKERMPDKPSGVMKITPDWVCEIISPGYEKKDTLHIFNILLRHQVPYYWIVWPEDKALIAYKLIDSKYMAIESIENGGKVRIAPFEEIEFDLDYIFE